METEKLIICECNDVEHQIIIRYDEEDKIAFLSVHLGKFKFFKRVYHAIKYIFGHKSIYGDFDEILIGKKYADFFIELGNKLKNDNDN